MPRPFFIGSKPPVTHLAYGLKYLASYLPGGVKTMLNLACLARDERVRDVARRWRALDKRQQLGIEIEDLCHEAGVEDADFVGEVAATALELGVDVGSLIGGISQMPSLLVAPFKTAESGEGLEQTLDAVEFFKKGVQRR